MSELILARQSTELPMATALSLANYCSLLPTSPSSDDYWKLSHPEGAIMSPNANGLRHQAGA